MISVVVPTLNEEKLLEPMLRQFTPEVKRLFAIDVIVSDGGSGDKTLMIAHNLADVVVENAQGTKQTIALGRNCGASAAKGDVLVFFNADTLVEDIPRFFRRMNEVMCEPAVVAMTCKVSVFPEERRRSDDVFHGFFNWLFSMMNLVGMAMGRGECHVIRRWAFEAVGGYSTTIAAGEDYDLFRRLARKGTVRFVNDLTVFESPRRFRKFGYWGVMGSWFVNFLWVSILHRSIASEWKPIRLRTNV